MQILSFLGIVLISFVIGGMTVASGQLFLAIREIALNTRDEKSEKKAEYGMLETMAKLNNVVGWLIIIVGVIGGLLVLFSGGGSYYPW